MYLVIPYNATNFNSYGIVVKHFSDFQDLLNFEDFRANEPAKDLIAIFAKVR